MLETGRLARQAAGSALVRYGDTMVLAAVTVSPNVSTLPFFPLTVEYREKTYAAGKIPGGFLKREGRPSDKEILASRLIDRSIRPLFPEGFKNEVQVFVTVLSADQENDADVLGVVAAATALGLSTVPWNGPLAAVRVGRVEGNWILNPTFQQLEFSSIDLVVSGSADSIMMVEGGSLETIRQMVAGGVGVTVLPATSTATSGGSSDLIRILPFARPAPTRRVGLAWRRSFPRPEAIEALRKAILATNLPQVEKLAS